MKSASYLYSLRLLAKRDYSIYKLRNKLLDKNFDPEEVEETIDYLLEVNYLREDEYKRIRVKQLLTKRYSNNYIIQKCDQEHIQVNHSFIDEIRSEYQLLPIEQINYLIEKKLRNIKPEELKENYIKIKKRLFNFLTSKGHKYNIFAPLVEEKLKNIIHSESH